MRTPLQIQLGGFFSKMFGSNCAEDLVYFKLDLNTNCTNCINNLILVTIGRKTAIKMQLHQGKRERTQDCYSCCRQIFHLKSLEWSLINPISQAHLGIVYRIISHHKSHQLSVLASSILTKSAIGLPKWSHIRGIDVDSCILIYPCNTVINDGSSIFPFANLSINLLALLSKNTR